MPKPVFLKLTRLASLTATVALVIQTLLPGGLFNLPLHRALATTTETKTWNFDAAADYTLASGVTIVGSYAALDLTFTASGSAVLTATTNDLVESTTAGTILAANLAANVFPVSTDYGATWADAGLSYANNPIHYNLTRITAGANTGRIVAGGVDDVGGSIHYTTDEGATWSITPSNIASSTRVTAIEYVNGLLYCGTGAGSQTNDGKIYTDPNDGNGPWTAGTLPAGVDIANVYGFAAATATRVVAAVGLDAAVTGKVSILYSDDSGATWTQSSVTGSATANLAALGITIAPSYGNIYAVTSDGDYILKSTDHGASFDAITVSGVDDAKVIYAAADGEIIAVKDADIFHSFDGTAFGAQGTDPTGITDSTSLIRMSNNKYLLATTASGGRGEAYIGNYFASLDSGIVRYAVNTTGVSFEAINTFSDADASTAEGKDIKYQVSVTGSGGPWYWHNGAIWTASGELSANSNIATTINTYISDLVTDLKIEANGGTFYFRALLERSSTNTYGTGLNSVALDSVTVTYEAPGPTCVGCPTDETPPESEVIGVLDNNGNVVPMPDTIYESTFTIVAKAKDNISLARVDLWFARTLSEPPTLWGRGTRDNPIPGQWSWVFDSESIKAWGDGFYYFYSMATDDADNAEERPEPGYDTSTTIHAERPCIDKTEPDHEETKVGDETSILVSFSHEMDKTSVENAFAFYKGETKGSGEGLDLGWSFEWGPGWFANGYFIDPSGRNQAYIWLDSGDVLVRHNQPFEDSTTYTAWINPAGARDDTGYIPLDDSGAGKPNPWTFTTDIPQMPDLSNSAKGVSVYSYDPDAGGCWEHGSWHTNCYFQPKDNNRAEPGDYLRYVITIDNSDSTPASNTTLLDVIPPHTTFVPGSIRVEEGGDLWVTGGLWIQLAPPRSHFEAWYEESDDGISGNGQVAGAGSIVRNQPILVIFMVKIEEPLANGTVITNTAKISDGVNDPHEKSASVTVGSTTNWDNSFKRAENADPARTPGTAEVGDTLTYTIYWENSGDMDATTVNVFDAIPAYTSIIGTPTGGLKYDDATDSLSWSGEIAAGDNRTFTFQVQVDSQPPLGKIVNTAILTDGIGQIQRIKAATIVGGGGKVYIVPPMRPDSDETSVKLFSPIVITFSGSIDTDTLKYTVSIDAPGNAPPAEIYDNSEGTWTETWAPNPDGYLNAEVTIQPDKPFRSGRTYTVEVTDAIGENGEPLGKEDDIPVPGNTWSFTTVRPALYFTDPSILSLKAGEVSKAVTVKLGDWINFDDSGAKGREYGDYAVEDPKGVTIKLYTTHATGRFDTDPKGKFDGKVKSVSIPQGTDTITFYYTDKVATFPLLHNIVAYDQPAGYGIDDALRKVVIYNTPPPADQIYFTTDSQGVTVDELSRPIKFGISNPDGRLVTIEAGREFLLESTSETGEFYDQFQLLLDQYAIAGEGDESAIYYLLTIPEDTTQPFFYYQDSRPGTYSLTIHDKALVAAAEGNGPASSASQDIFVLPFEEEELVEEKEELEEVKDETKRELDYIVIDPTETTLLPGGVRTFKAKGYDIEGKEIAELKFSWYVIGGGGTILKKGLKGNSHSSVFTADKVPGVYVDTVLVAALYNGAIKATMASVIVADVVDYGGPGELPSTGPNGIQLLFIMLTLLSAVALAAVEHYEKTHFYEEAKATR